MRTKRARRGAKGLLALTLLGTGAWLTWNLTFPSRAQPVPGTPYTLRVQPGVPDADVTLVRDALRLANAHVERTLGRAPDRPVSVRLARFSPCAPFYRVSSGVTAVANARFICVNTSGYGWGGVRTQPILARSVIAHEAFHVWQGQIGCLPRPNARQYAWWVEGSATHMGWATVIGAGLVTPQAARAHLRRWGGERPDLPPLRALEKTMPGDPEYALAARAVQTLVDRAGPASLRVFCEQVHEGVPWRRAFERAFGQPVDAFYHAFEASRTRAR